MLVLGYGNPGRQDDGLGPAFAEALDALDIPGVSVHAAFQLNIEDAANASEHDAVLFADADAAGSEPYAITKAEPAPTVAFTSHAVAPGAILAICEDYFGKRPKAWVLGIRGYTFEFAEGLSPEAQKNLELAVAFVQSWIATSEE